MTALVVMIWILGFAIWSVSRLGRAAASQRQHPSGAKRIDTAPADCDPVWSALDDRQLERLLRDAAS